MSINVVSTTALIISKPNIQITQNKKPVEANYIAYHIIVNFFKTDIQLSQKNFFNDALLLTHAVLIKNLSNYLMSFPCIKGIKGNVL